jgi:hypothetical protein
MNIRETFLKLTQWTYPHGTEDKLRPYLPKGIQEDDFGNYFIKIGESDTMFTCHLDTCSSLYQKVNHVIGSKIIKTDGTTILGADDKAGMTVLLYMIEKGVPGLYYFFIGEEVGGIGSSAASSMSFSGYNKCVSFDRRGYDSVITEQWFGKCCSDEFAKALANELNKKNLTFNFRPDPTGIFTDSASFMNDIPECTNISVGYYSEHTGKERQNINYLERLAKASVKVNWDSLPTTRKIGIDEETIRKYGKLINDIKATPFGIDVKIASDRATTFIQCDLEEGYIDETYEALTTLQFLLNKHKVSQKVYFDAEYIKIDLL